MKKLLMLVGLTSLGYLIYSAYKRKRDILDFVDALPDMIDNLIPDTEVTVASTVADAVNESATRCGSPHSHHASGFHQELDTSVTVDTVEIPYSDTLVWKWLSENPEAIVSKAGHSWRREGQGKYTPIFNALHVCESHIFKAIKPATATRIRSAMNRFQRKYGWEFKFKRLHQWQCSVTRVL